MGRTIHGFRSEPMRVGKHGPHLYHVPPHPFPQRLRSLVTLVPRFTLDRPHSDSDWFHGIYVSVCREKRGTERTTQTGHTQPVEQGQCPEPTEDATRISKHRGHHAHWQLLLLCSRVQAAQHATRLSPTTVHALIRMFRNLFP